MRELSEAFDTGQPQARGLTEPIDTAVGEIHVTTNGYRINDQSWGPRASVPLLGQHSRELLAEQAGTRCPFPYEVVFEPSQTIDEELILSRYPVKKRETVDLHSALAPGFTRHVLRARIDHPARKVDLYTTHLASGSDLATSPCEVDRDDDGDPEIPCPSACMAAGAATVRECQAVELAEAEQLGAGPAVALRGIRALVPPLEDDRPLGRDVESIACGLLAEGQLLAGVRAATMG